MIAFQEDATPEATVVIVGLRDAPLLLRCLESLARNVKQAGFEVIVVLNDPTPRLCAELEGEVSGARVTRLRANLGFGGAVNRAARLARGRYLVLLNDDCTVAPDWLEALVDTARRHPRCGVVGSTFLNSDGSLQEAGSIIWADGTTMQVGADEQPGFMSFERRVDYCGGGSLLIRKDMWDLLGGFDERYYPAYYEDVDLCLRAMEAGWEVWYQPLSVVHHTLSASTTELERDFYVERSRGTFVQRWSDFLQHQEPKGEIERAIRAALDRPLPAIQTCARAARVDDVESEPDDLEISALRRELEIRLALNASMEHTVMEQRRHIDWLQRHVEEVTHAFDAERKQMAEDLASEQRRAAESQRRAAESQAATDLAEQALAATQQTLAAERARASYVAVQRFTSRMSKYPVVLGWLRHAGRVFLDRR